MAKYSLILYRIWVHDASMAAAQNKSVQRGIKKEIVMLGFMLVYQDGGCMPSSEWKKTGKE